MNTRIFLSFLLISSPALVRAQTSPGATAATGTAVVKLDPFVVSSGFDEKTAFDLAQGTAILNGDELRARVAATIGESLAGTPGVSATSYGPGASRPVIRGLGGDRVRVLDNGVGALDASNVSPDHNTALEPLFATGIEVLRGPATLLYGSSAVGGAVNVIGNEVPATAPAKPVLGSVELRGAGAADERTGVAAFTLGGTGFALQLNALTQRTGDLAIPGVARTDAAAPAVQPAGTLPNSDLTTRSGSLGAAWFFPAGRLGAAVSTYTTLYGVPTDEPISIKMHQRRLDLQGELNPGGGWVKALRARFDLGDYRHSEVADRTTINTTFRNQAWEGRIEVPHVWSTKLSGTFGVQAARSDFSAVGEEVVTPPSITSSQAVFVLEEWKFPGGAFQAGARLERQSVRLGEVDPALPAVPGYGAVSGQKATDNGTSGSAGLVLYPARDWSIGANLAYTERLPTAQERFSNGPHGGTAAWEVGTAALAREKSVGFDLGVRRRAGFVTGSVGIFLNRFRGYVFEDELPLTAIPAGNNPDGLTPYQFVAKDAEFRGAEADLTLHLYDANGRRLHLDLMADSVRAEQTTDHVPLPRTPPVHYGVGLRWEDAHWQLEVETQTAARQDRVAAAESPTAGSTRLNASIAYTRETPRAGWQIFARGQNLTNREARAHPSFLKEFAPLPGRGVTVGTRVTF
jgi:iron complex outermembrane receptor protein